MQLLVSIWHSAVCKLWRTLFHLGRSPPFPHPVPFPDSRCTQPQPINPSALHIPAHTHPLPAAALKEAAMTSHHIPPQVALLLQGIQCLCGTTHLFCSGYGIDISNLCLSVCHLSSKGTEYELVQL